MFCTQKPSINNMAVKKMRSKTHKSVSKRLKVTKGGDLINGKIILNKAGDNHYNTRKSRSRTIKAKRDVVADKIHNKLKAVI
jgi:ribosomal protein L35